MSAQLRVIEVNPDTLSSETLAELVANAERIEVNCVTKCSGPECWDVCTWRVYPSGRRLKVRLVKSVQGSFVIEPCSNCEPDIVVSGTYPSTRYGTLATFKLLIPKDAVRYPTGEGGVVKWGNKILVYTYGDAYSPSTAALYEIEE